MPIQMIRPANPDDSSFFVFLGERGCHTPHTPSSVAPVDKFSEQHCYISAGGLLQLVRFDVTVYSQVFSLLFEIAW
jgi:hypothetical protein